MVLFLLEAALHEVCAAHIASGATEGQGFESADDGSGVRGIYYLAHMLPYIIVIVLDLGPALDFYLFSYSTLTVSPFNWWEYDVYTTMIMPILPLIKKHNTQIVMQVWQEAMEVILNNHTCFVI